MKSTSLSLATIGFLMLCFGSNKVSAQAVLKVGTNLNSIQPKAVLEIESTTKGFLPPRMTDTQLTAMGNVEGMIAWCTDCTSTSGSKLMINNGSEWVSLLGYKLASGKLLIGNSLGIAEESTTSGLGSIVLSNSPTLVNPDLGTPSAGIATNITGLPLTTGVTGVLPIANGGTGSSTQNFVDVSSTQSVGGAKTFSAALTANSFVKTGGTSSQFLMANGSVSSGTPLLTDADDEITATAGQTSFTLTQTPSTLTKVKMYINGIRISKTAYSISGTTLTYVPANNESYPISVNDRVQFEYAY
ncbi:hypothetical protein MCEGE10_00296 [Flavobacteriaceae bacterium]